MTLTSIHTPTRDQLSRTRIEVTRPTGGGRVAVGLTSAAAGDGPVVRPVLVSSDEYGAQVSLVPEGALLLSGDDVLIEVYVGCGLRLELVEPGGTVAYVMEGGSASWEVRIDLAAKATLVWAGEPFVVSAGATVDRTTTVTVGSGAVLAVREMLVLGRHGERPGTVRQELAVTGPLGVPILHETFHVGPQSSSLLLGGARAIGTVLLVGGRLPVTSDGTRLDLHEEGTVVRSLATEAHRAAPVQAWRAARCVRA